MTNVVSVEKAMRKFNYLQTKMMKFVNRNRDIIYKHNDNVHQFENFKRGCNIYSKCSVCNNSKLVRFEDYIKNPIRYKDWICRQCELEIIRTADERMHTKRNIHWGLDLYIFDGGMKMYIMTQSSGKYIADQFGRRKYGVD
jgi:hypothetical protein